MVNFMRHISLYVLTLALLAGCGAPRTDIFGNPIVGETDVEERSADESIQRSEAESTEIGRGFLRSYEFDADNDIFLVEGLAFDGNQPDGEAYARMTPPGDVGGFGFFIAPVTFPDSLTDVPIGQFQHVAIFKESDSGETEVAIVRTGGYLDYGFGGYMYSRDNGVTIPADGQATYQGDYVGLRDFTNRGGLEYVTGVINIDIDFSGFRGACEPECDNAIRGYVTDREFVTVNGVNVTADYVAALSSKNEDAPITILPSLIFKVGPGSAGDNGLIDGDVFESSFEATLNNNTASGTYEGILAGDHTLGPGGEIVGVIVTTAEDPRFDDVSVTETGGFIADRLQN